MTQLPGQLFTAATSSSWCGASWQLSPLAASSNDLPGESGRSEAPTVEFTAAKRLSHSASVDVGAASSGVAAAPQAPASAAAAARINSSSAAAASVVAAGDACMLLMPDHWSRQRVSHDDRSPLGGPRASGSIRHSQTDDQDEACLPKYMHTVGRAAVLQRVAVTPQASSQQFVLMRSRGIRGQHSHCVRYSNIPDRWRHRLTIVAASVACDMCSSCNATA